MGDLDQGNLFENVRAEDFGKSIKNLYEIIKDKEAIQHLAEANKWAGKLEQLKNLLVESNERQFKMISKPLLKGLNTLYKGEFEIAKNYNLDDYGGDTWTFKQDLFVFVLHRLHQDGVRNILIIEKNPDRIELIKEIYANFCNKNTKAPALVIELVQNGTFKRCFVGSPKSPEIKQKQKDPWVTCCILLPFIVTGKVVQKTSLPVLGVMTALSFIGSFLSEEQNQVLWKGFSSDSFRTDFITSLTTPCAHVPGNYASYVCGTVLILLGLGYYFRNTIKKRRMLLRARALPLSLCPFILRS